MKTRNALALSLLLAAIAKAFALDLAIVSGNSMLPTLKDGQLVLVNKLAWGLRLPLTERYILRWGSPKAGDIAVFLRNGTYAIKRCIATEGMSLLFSEDGGRSVLAGGERIPLTEEQYKRLAGSEGAIPRGKVFAAGDNRAASFDSRDYGLVDAGSFCGKVLGFGGRRWMQGRGNRGGKHDSIPAGIESDFPSESRLISARTLD